MGLFDKIKKKVVGKDVFDTIKKVKKARKELNWSPKTSFDELVKLMIEHDLVLAEQEKVLIQNKLMTPTWENPII